jgi:hypothetical protein
MLRRTSEALRPPVRGGFARSTRRRLVTAFAVTVVILVGPAAASAPAAPVNGFPPEVVGRGVVGERLVCGAGSWSGVVSQFRYTWVRDAIVVGSGVAYRITVADKGHLLWCVVTATGADGSSTEAESANSVRVEGNAPKPPIALAAPEVSGTPAVGATLTCSKGQWSEEPTSFSYQWWRDQATINQATSSTYRVQGEDQGHSLSCEVTAANAAGKNSEKSKNSLRVAGSPPANTEKPRVLGVAEVTQSLTCNAGRWSGSPEPTFSYQWLRDGASIPLASGKTYNPEPADQGHSVSCLVTATNGEGEATAQSAGVEITGPPPENLTPPVIAGTPSAGETLLCSTGSWTGVPQSYKYAWLRDGTAILSATTSEYAVVTGDRGHSLSCQVTAYNNGGSGLARESAPVVVPLGSGTEKPANTTPPKVSGTAVAGESLSCSAGSWTGEPALAYQWIRDRGTSGEVSIASATASTYEVQQADRGHRLSCVVIATNGEGSAEAASANAEHVSGSAPQNTLAPALSGASAPPRAGDALTCSPGLWTGAPPPAFAYRWLRDGATTIGLGYSYSLSNADRGHSVSCTVTASNAEGMATAQSTTLYVPGSPPQSSTPPSILGTPAVTETLTCSPGVWDGAPPPVFSYQWFVNGVEIQSATMSTYTVASVDRGLPLSCRVTATNSEGTRSALSQDVRVIGIRPENVEAPRVVGTPGVGQTLTCARGMWNGKPPPVFTYRWLRDGTVIASATGATYTVEPIDLSHSLSCVVAAANEEGTAEASSSNAVVIVRLTPKAEVRPEPAFPSVSTTVAPEQILAALRVQLRRAQHRVRVASLRRMGLFTFPVSMPAAGRLALSWSQLPAGTRRSTNAQPVSFAQASTSFAAPGAGTVKLRLTAAGRRLLARSSRVALAVKGVFIPASGRHVTWRDVFVLNH